MDKEGEGQSSKGTRISLANEWMAMWSWGIWGLGNQKPKLLPVKTQVGTCCPEAVWRTRKASHAALHPWSIGPLATEMWDQGCFFLTNSHTNPATGKVSGSVASGRQDDPEEVGAWSRGRTGEPGCLPRPLPRALGPSKAGPLTIL